MSAEDAEDAENFNTFLSTEDTEGRGEHLTALDPRRGAKNIFPVRGRLGKSLFLSRKVAEGLHLSALKRPAPIVNKT